MFMHALQRRFALLTSLIVLCAAAARGQTLTLTPGTAQLATGATAQFTAALTGSREKGLLWYVNGIQNGSALAGTITGSGLYTAPAISPAGPVVVKAQMSNGRASATATVSVIAVGPAISSVSPNPVPLGVFTLSVNSAAAFLPGALVYANGAPMACAYVSSSKLTCIGKKERAGTAALQVQNPLTPLGAAYTIAFGGTVNTPIAAPSVAPSTATMPLGTSLQFTAPGATNWSATAGSVTANGLYTAPSTMTASGVATLTATGPGGSASATILLQQAMSISPAATSLYLGGTQQFTSTGATSWSATAGTITSSGLYTAPATMPSSSSVIVTASNAGGSGSAVISLLSATPGITGVGSATLPLGVFTTTVKGTNFNAASVAQLNGVAISTTYANGSLNVTGFSAQSGQAALTVANGGAVSAPYTVQIGIQNALAKPPAARRFLEQAAFGPTPADAAHVQAVGMAGWIGEQLAMAPVSNYSGITATQGGMPNHFLTMAVSNPDQLRQRVAFALSQIFVTSINKVIWNGTMIVYEDMLLKDALGNFRTLMEDVTLSAAMGTYLDMVNNAKANPATGSVANENFARELMQLFTLGTNLVNPDGTLKYDAAGNPIPTYTQFQVTEFARVFTGWTYAANPGSIPTFGSYRGTSTPMVADASQHDFGSKQLLVGYTSPANSTPQQDLDNALDNIFNHPNCGPFVARLLIQHLVKSNPSPAYVGRVVAAFNDNGKGVRGDLAAVVTAILLDAEARANDAGASDQPTDGHLQEPALYVAGMVRALGGTMNDSNYLYADVAAMGEDLYSSPSVFNYYSESGHAPGTSLAGGEFQIHTPNNAILRANMVANLFSAYSNPIQSNGPGTTIDLSPYLPLAATPSLLADALDLTLTHGTMPASMKSQIVGIIGNTQGGSLRQVQSACYAILTSGYYNVWH